MSTGSATAAAPAASTPSAAQPSSSASSAIQSADTAPVIAANPFETEEILWYNNGRWGQAGYAITNPGGKTWTSNSVIYQIHSLVGRNLFELMHRPAVKFYVAPDKQWLYDLHQLLITARKRLADRTRMPNDSNGLVPQHADPDPQMFLVWPVPYFGERVRQMDIREYCQIALLMLSDIMQHSENDLSSYVTNNFTGPIGKYLQEILMLMATKYFGYSRAAAYDPAFALQATDFANYDPSKVMTSVEMSEERPPVQWWPTTNDLSQIRGIPVNQALLLATRWPADNWQMAAGGDVTNNNNAAATAAAAQPPTGAAATPFTAPPGQAP